jgi:hypothetical protein
VKTKTVEYQDDEFKAHIVVRRGSILENLVREQLKQNSLRPKSDQPKEDGTSEATAVSPVDLFEEARRTVEIVVWPTIFAGTIEGVIYNPDGSILAIWPFSFDMFLSLSLSQELVDAWVGAIWELNPSWEPKELPKSDEERKAEKKD